MAPTPPTRSVARTERLFGAAVHETDHLGNEWNARWHRRGRSSEHTTARAVSWSITGLFLVGSLLFVVGGVGAFADEGWVGAVNLVGATLFSLGAGLAVVEARAALRARGHGAGLSDLWADPGGRAALIQLPAAALFFQIAMIAGMLADLDWAQLDALLWTPSTIGSIGFVISSWIAWREATPAHDIGTWTTLANLAGSIGFLAGSATGYLDEPNFGLAANTVTNPVFLAGSTLFLVGSVLAAIELKTPTSTKRTTSESPTSQPF